MSDSLLPNAETLKAEMLKAESVPSESMWGNASVRSWLAVILIVTVCLISLMSALAAVKAGQEVNITEPLYSLAVAALGFYFGQKTKSA